MQQFSSKRPGEIINLTFDFTLEVPAGVTITSATVTQSILGGPGGSITLSGSPTISGSKVFQMVSGGTANADYMLVAGVNLSSGEYRELAARLPVNLG